MNPAARSRPAAASRSRSPGPARPAPARPAERLVVVGVDHQGGVAAGLRQRAAVGADHRRARGHGLQAPAARGPRAATAWPAPRRPRTGRAGRPRPRSPASAPGRCRWACSGRVDPASTTSRPWSAERRRQPVQQRQVLARQVGAHGQHVAAAPGRSAARTASAPAGSRKRSSTPRGAMATRAGSTPRCWTIWSRETVEMVSTSRARRAIRGAAPGASARRPASTTRPRNGATSWMNTTLRRLATGRQVGGRQDQPAAAAEHRQRQLLPGVAGAGGPARAAARSPGSGRGAAPGRLGGQLARHALDAADLARARPRAR